MPCRLSRDPGYLFAFVFFRVCFQFSLLCFVFAFSFLLEVVSSEISLSLLRSLSLFLFMPPITLSPPFPDSSSLPTSLLCFLPQVCSFFSFFFFCHYQSVLFPSPFHAWVHFFFFSVHLFLFCYFFLLSPFLCLCYFYLIFLYMGLFSLFVQFFFLLSFCFIFIPVDVKQINGLASSAEDPGLFLLKGNGIKSSQKVLWNQLLQP